MSVLPYQNKLLIQAEKTVTDYPQESAIGLVISDNLRLPKDPTTTNCSVSLGQSSSDRYPVQQSNCLPAKTQKKVS